MRFVHKILYLLCLALTIFCLFSKSYSQSTNGIIVGSVTDFENNALFNVNIVILGTSLGTASDKLGNYRIENVPPGEYTLKFMYIGYESEIEKKVFVKASQITRINKKLRAKVLQMREIVVTPGNFSVSQSQTAKRQVIEKDRITSLPATLDDICRVLQVMPGASFSDDFSAHFHVRGGKQNENLILLDGMEIYDPYHLKNIGGAVGVMNMDLIENVTILTGGFPAKYGDKLSSVVVVENRIGEQKNFSGTIGIGGTGARLVLEGPSPRGSWIFSFRKSFLKEAATILNPTDYTISPSFYDAQTKFIFKVNNSNKIMGNILYSKDNSYLEKWQRNTDLYSDYGNSYYGLVWQSILSRSLLSEFIMSRGENFWDNRIGEESKEQLKLTENVMNWNLDFQPNDRYELEWGMTFKNIYYHYQFETEEIQPEEKDFEKLVESFSGNVDINPKTYKFAAFLQNKFKLFQPVVANIGMRYDYFEYNQDQQWSPRIGLAYSMGNKTIFRAAYGLYYQAPIYTELADTKGVDFNPRAERATHYVLGVEHYFTSTLSIRMEGYIKTLNRMIGHYFEEQDAGDLPVLRYGNPYDGQAKGIEFFINGKIVSALSLWFTYCYSKTKIDASIVDWENKTVEIKKVPRFTDQPHNLSLFINYKLPKNWEINLKWRYLSGIPYTPNFPVWDNYNNPRWRSGELYSSRYPAYHRLDMRIGKKLDFKNFDLFFFLEIKNVYNQKNILLYHYTIENDKHVKKVYYMLPFLPLLECSLSF